MNPIRTERLVLRQWQDRDRSLFHRINSDDQVMEFFSARRTREQSDELLDMLREEIDRKGFCFAAIEPAAIGDCIGFAGLHEDSVMSSWPAGTIEIGWRLAPEYWGKGYMTEAAEGWLAFGFETLSLDEIVSFAVWNNFRSTAVMERLGMRRDPARDFDHPRVPDTQPHLKRHVFYRLSREDWRKRKKAAG